MQEMAAINGSAKVSAEYGPLQSTGSDETTLAAAPPSISSRKKKTLRRAGAVNYDEDEGGTGVEGDDEGAHNSLSEKGVAGYKYESPGKNAAKSNNLGKIEEAEEDDIDLRINFNNPVRKSPGDSSASLELSELGSRKQN